MTDLANTNPANGFFGLPAVQWTLCMLGAFGLLAALLIGYIPIAGCGSGFAPADLSDLGIYGGLATGFCGSATGVTRTVGLGVIVPSALALLWGVFARLAADRAQAAPPDPVNDEGEVQG